MRFDEKQNYLFTNKKHNAWLARYLPRTMRNRNLLMKVTNMILDDEMVTRYKWPVRYNFVARYAAASNKSTDPNFYLCEVQRVWFHHLVYYTPLLRGMHFVIKKSKNLYEKI